MALNKLVTKIIPIEDLKNIFSEVLFNNTSKISKISKTSVINAISFGVSKIAQKSIKDIAVLESQIFPEFATGQHLDRASIVWGVGERLQESGSSAYVLVRADQGTVYRPGENVFLSTNGIEFQLTEQRTIGRNGWDYLKVRSVGSGSVTNVDPLTINIVNPEPIGHIACSNEYKAIGGRDTESDETFRERIISSINKFPRDTIGHITEVLRGFDESVFRVYNTGIDDQYQINLSILRVDGSDYTKSELVEMSNYLSKYLSLNDSLGQFSGGGVKLNNMSWTYIDIDFRVDIFENFNTDNVRRNIQIQISKLLNFRFTEKRRILWVDLFESTRNVQGVRFVPVGNFNPSNDQTILNNTLPRIRSYKMRDMQGNIIFDSFNQVSPILYV